MTDSCWIAMDDGVSIEYPKLYLEHQLHRTPDYPHLKHTNVLFLSFVTDSDVDRVKDYVKSKYRVDFKCVILDTNVILTSPST